MNSSPSRATRSNAGVFTHVVPYALACGNDWSSEIAKRIFGRDADAPNAETARARGSKRSARRGVMRKWYM
jgi:hypothetical protein